MNSTPPPSIPPIRRSIVVPWAPQAAFDRFTAQFGTWWPSSTHSIGGPRVNRIVFECRVGGQIIEELRDGRRYQWGRVTAWDPPRRVGFTWHPSQDERQAQDIEVTFAPEGRGSRVELISSGWERLGAKGRRARRGYDIGWGSVLSVFAGRRSAAVVVFAMLSHAIGFWLAVTGRLDASIEGAGGRLPATSAESISKEASHETAT